MIAPRAEAQGRIVHDGAILHDGHLKVFNHHVYEYRKGLRHLALQTLPREHEAWVTDRLDKLGIDYLVLPAGEQHINVFLGDPECLEVIRLIGKFYLSHYSPEEDFMLGIMLGYDRRQQCARYLNLIRQVNGDREALLDDKEGVAFWDSCLAVCREELR